MPDVHAQRFWSATYSVYQRILKKIRLSCYWTLDLYIFCMKINYAKSALIPINMSEEDTKEYAEALGCKKSNFPTKYLRIPLRYDKLRREGILPLMDNIIERIAGWRGKLLSYNGRLILIHGCLPTIHIYLLSIFLILS